MVPRGTGTPETRSSMRNTADQETKYSVFQPGPPNAMLFTCVAPWTIVPTWSPPGDHPQAARAAAVDVALEIDLHAVGGAGSLAAEAEEHALRRDVGRAVGWDVVGLDVGADVADAVAVVDVQHALVRCERQPVRHAVAGGSLPDGTVGPDPVERRIGQLARVAGAEIPPRAREVDGAVGADDDVVGPPETRPVVAVGHDRVRAVAGEPADPPTGVLGGEDRTVAVERRAVGGVVWRVEHREPCAGRPREPTVVADVAEEQVPGVGIPDGALQRAGVLRVGAATEVVEHAAAPELFDRDVRRHDPVHAGVEPLHTAFDRERPRVVPRRRSGAR